MKATTGKLSDWVIKSACGRDFETQLQDVTTTGQHGAPQMLRAMALGANGFAGSPQQADLALVFGCYRPFSTPNILREVAWILGHLGMAHTWLEKENCCGLPLMHQVASEDRPQMVEAAQGFVRGNSAAAALKGASRIAYCCAGCAHVAESVDADGDISHSYILDVLLDALKGQRLRVKPLKVAYFEGCHTSYRRHFPQTSLNWPAYRQFLEKVEGLEVLDVAGGLCCKNQPDRIVAAALDGGVDALVCACSGCTVAVRGAGQGKLRVMSYTELLARALGCEPAGL